MARKGIHPGTILRERLIALGVSPTEFARRVCVPANRVSQIIKGQRRITGDSSLRFGKWFGDEDGYWLGLQMQYDLGVARGRLGRNLRRISRYKA